MTWLEEVNLKEHIVMQVVIPTNMSNFVDNVKI
jgi:hypothetical protein